MYLLFFTWNKDAKLQEIIQMQQCFTIAHMGPGNEGLYQQSPSMWTENL